MPFSGARKTQQSLKSTPTRKYGAFTAKNLDKTLLPSSIATAEAFGTTTVLITSRPAIGGKTRLSISGVSQPRAGSFTAHTGNLVLTGIASAETIGSHIIIGGTLVLTPTAIASAEAIGTHTIQFEGLFPVGIASGETFGVTELIPLGTISPSAIDGSMKLAAWTANTEPDLAGYRVYVSTSPLLVLGINTSIWDVGLTSTPSTPEYVIANLSPGTTYYVAITAYDTSNNESGFSTTVSFVASADGSRFGDVNVVGNRNIEPAGLSSAETIGAHTLVPGQVTVLPPSIASGETFGVSFVVQDTFFLGPVSIASAEAFGTLSLLSGDITLDLTNGTVASAEAFGDPTVFGTQLIDLVGQIASAEALGIPLVETGGDQLVRLIALTSDELFGTTQLDLEVVIPSLGDGAAIGALALNVDISFSSILTAEAFGNLTVLPGGVDVFPLSIASLEGLGTYVLIPGELQLPVRVFNARARTFVFPSGT